MSDKPYIYRFNFNEKVPFDAVETHLFWSVFTAECEYGKSRVRLEASFYASRDTKQCVIDGSTEVGQAIAKLFTGLISQEYGEGSFKVERLDKKPPEGMESKPPCK